MSEKTVYQDKAEQRFSTRIQIAITCILLFGGGSKAFYDISSNKEKIRVEKEANSKQMSQMKADHKEQMNTVLKALEEVDDRIDHIPLIYVQKTDYVKAQESVVNEVKDISRKIDTNQQQIRDKLLEQRKYIEADYNRRMDKLEATLEKVISKP